MTPADCCNAGDTRGKISNYLHNVGLPLDLRTKAEGRFSMDKFYDGGGWQQFICGGGKSPGGAVIIAHLVKIVADHFEELQAASQAKVALQTAQQAAASSITTASNTAAISQSSRPRKRGRGGAAPQQSGHSHYLACMHAYAC
eukprot:4937045-Pleurochrysis_carterae.AAC.1